MGGGYRRCGRSAGESLDQSVNAVGANECSPAELNGFQLTFVDQLVDFGCADPERTPGAGDGDGEGFHSAVSLAGTAPCSPFDRDPLLT